MSATVWHRRINSDPRSFLLGNGEVITEPTLEQSGSGRKVRIQAAPHLSTYTANIDELLADAVDLVARQKGTFVWLGLHGRESNLKARLGFDPDETRATLFLNNAPAQHTIAWWKFRHPTLPIEAVLHLKARHRTAGIPSNGQIIEGVLTAPRAHPSGGVQLKSVHQGATNRMLSTLTNGDDVLREFVRDNEPDWPIDDLLGAHEVGSETAMVRKLLELVRLGDELDTIQIPVPGQDEPRWLDLELYETNVNTNFIGDLVDYLDGSSTVAEAARIYEELRACMRGLGVYLNEISENDFNRGLLGGQDKFVLATLTHVLEDANLSAEARDHSHTLRMHLPSGTFIVDCDVKDNNTDEALQRWDEALTIASLTGEEDVLVRYARLSAKEAADKRAKEILTQRRDVT